jgi:hypothetical protein
MNGISNENPIFHPELLILCFSAVKNLALNLYKSVEQDIP